MKLEELVEVKNSPIHGKGVFAKKDIKKGTRIGKYEGEKTSRDSRYVLWLMDDDSEWYGVKGNNSLKYLNHSGKHNAEFNDLGEVFARKKIKEGEEVTVHYGENWKDIE